MKKIILKKENITEGNLILVNRSFPVSPGRKEVSLKPVRPDYPDILLAKEAVENLGKLLRDLEAEAQIVPVSGFRTREDQEDIYRSSMEENGKEYTVKYVAPPDGSEHQTGLAIDLAENVPDIDFIAPEFPYTGICQLFRQLAPRYGFVERYQQRKETITGVAQDPWHFRYVGRPHASLMQMHNFTLEQYLAYLKQFPYDGNHLFIDLHGKRYEIFTVQAGDEPVQIPCPELCSCTVSGNNVDGFIITMFWQNIID